MARSVLYYIIFFSTIELIACDYSNINRRDPIRKIKPITDFFKTSGGKENVETLLENFVKIFLERNKTDKLESPNLKSKVPSKPDNLEYISNKNKHEFLEDDGVLQLISDYLADYSIRNESFGSFKEFSSFIYNFNFTKKEYCEPLEKSNVLEAAVSVYGDVLVNYEHPNIKFGSKDFILKKEDAVNNINKSLDWVSCAFTDAKLIFSKIYHKFKNRK